MAQSVVLKCRGLHTFPNALSELPEGALIEANNVVIDRESVVSPRRGFKLYGSVIDNVNSIQRAKQLIEYKGRILRHWGTTIDVDNGSGTFTTLSSDISEAESGIRIKSVESNGNLYFTTSSGVKKLSVSSASDLTTASITNAGLPKALNLYAEGFDDISGFLPTAHATAYRVVWVLKDNNQNLNFGAPSSRFIVRNDSGNIQNVTLTFPIPDGITTDHLYQIYRTTLITPTTTDPGDEMQLIYEDSPTSSEITNKLVTITDETPEDFLGVFLYTNPNSGEGILQANDLIPYCKDIASFRGSTFYANTKTRHRKFLTLLGTSSFSVNETGSITGNTVANPTVITSTGHNLTTGRTIKISGSDSTPSIDGEHTVTVIDADTFSIPVDVTIAGTSGIWVTTDKSKLIIESGLTTETYYFADAENASLKAIETFVGGTPAQNVDDTARSLVNVINTQSNGLVYAYYLSGDTDNDLPGKMLLEARTLNTDQFSLEVDDDSTSGTQFNPTLPDSSSGYSETSDNEVAQNRVYYSKTDQPESVPLLNYINVGAKDSHILRIIPLRDSLFVLKKDGIFRISGDSPGNFQVTLFDSSTNCKAGDTAAVLNNQIYMFADQGIATISDTGISVVSRPIENQLIPLMSPSYTNFESASFAFGYESDRSYLLFTVTDTTDTVATQCFRYNTFTNTWVMWDLTKTCGIVNTEDDKIYLGASDTPYIEIERKEFSRLDHADRESSITIPSGSVNDNTLSLGSLFDIEKGDVIVQTQYLTIGQFNRLLTKLDQDSGVADDDYFSTLGASAGADLLDKLNLLVAKLNADPGVADNDYTTSGSSVFATLQSDFNTIVTKLNNDAGVSFTNYRQSTGTVGWEVNVNTTDSFTQQITLGFAVPFVSGAATVYKKINSSVVWAPNHFGDPSLLKQIRESTILFENNAFTEASVSYATDLSPGFELISFEGEGSGTWGGFTWGDATWGGEGTAKPLRTYVPREKQRCRYINAKFEHSAAFEKYAVYGVSFTFEPTSPRAYR